MPSQDPASPVPDLFAKLSRVGHDAGLRVAARRPAVPHPSDEAIDAALDVYDDCVYRDFHRVRLTFDQRQRLRSLVVDVLTAALAVSSPSRAVIHPG